MTRFIGAQFQIVYGEMLRESISWQSIITENTYVFVKNNALILHYFRLHISALHKFTYGKHILAKLEAYYAKQQWTSQRILDFPRYSEISECHQISGL